MTEINGSLCFTTDNCERLGWLHEADCLEEAPTTELETINTKKQSTNDQFTLAQAAELVEFRKYSDGEWHVDTVKGNCRIVEGDCDYVEGDCGIVGGTVHRTINGRRWQYVETPKDKLLRLLNEGASKKELIDAVNQLEDN